MNHPGKDQYGLRQPILVASRSAACAVPTPAPLPPRHLPVSSCKAPVPLLFWLYTGCEQKPMQQLVQLLLLLQQL
jgi:hypothetical protein